VLPPSHWLSQLSLVDSFRWLGLCWQMALSEQGLASRLASPRNIKDHNARVEAMGLDWICFAGLGHGELLDTFGRKLVGLAQYRGAKGLVLSSGLLTAHVPWEDLEWVHHNMRSGDAMMHSLASKAFIGLNRRAIS